MKKIFILLLSVVFFSCSRNNSGLNTTGTQEISFDINGSHYAYTGTQTISNPVGVYAVRHKAIPNVFNAYYSFNGMASSNSQITLWLVADTLKTQTYHTTTGTGSQIITPSDSYSFVNSSDFIDITISSYQNGIVNGTFTGKLTNISNISQQKTITNGQLKNVKLIYQ